MIKIKKKRKKPDPGILISIWKHEGDLEQVKKFYIDRNSKTVDVNLLVTTETKTSTEVQWNTYDDFRKHDEIARKALEEESDKVRENRK